MIDHLYTSRGIDTKTLGGGRSAVTSKESFSFLYKIEAIIEYVF